MKRIHLKQKCQISLAAMSFACALACVKQVPSQQLVNARAYFEQAQRAPATQYALDSLYEAKRSLDEAEEAHEEDPNSYRELSLAYVAERKAQLAMARGGLAYAIDVKRNSERALVDRQQALLEMTRKDAAAVSNQLNIQAVQLQQTQTALEQERAAREVETSAQAVWASLGDIARVRSDISSTTITLDGAVMFPAGRATLLPAANDTLNRVARSIADIAPGATLKVVGHTDNQGNAANNQKLSLARAQRVADYLVQQGLDPSRIEALGVGEQFAATTNDTPEGRANNRRVELVVQQAVPSGLGSPGTVCADGKAAVPKALPPSPPVGDTNPIPIATETTPENTVVAPSRGSVH
jgi:outer membrane protein OmpA-like peptidoglycan-associated protein